LACDLETDIREYTLRCGSYSEPFIQQKMFELLRSNPKGIACLVKAGMCPNGTCVIQFSRTDWLLLRRWTEDYFIQFRPNPVAPHISVRIGSAVD